jgi:hypothetical protein
MVNETRRRGDCIVFKRSDGLYDVLKVTASGAHVSVGVGAGLDDVDEAHRIALNNLETGRRVLYSDHSTPDRFELYK